MDRYDKMGGDFDMHAGGFSELIGNEQIKERRHLHRHWSVRQNLPTDRAACAIHAHNF